MLSLSSRALAASLFSVAVLGANPVSAQTLAGNGGFTVGVFGQGTFSDIDFTETAIMMPPPPSSPPNGYETSVGDIDGAGAGISGGYDLPLGNGFFIGAEGDIAWGDWREHYDVSPTMVGFYDIRRIITVRGRAGVAVTQNAAVYATGGWAHARVQHGGFVPMPMPAPPPPQIIEFNMNGWTAGAGAQLNIFGFIAFLEWLHMDFGSASFVLHNELHNVELESETIKAGVKIPFGG